MSSDDPYGSGGGDWGQPQQPPQPQPQQEIDMNYGQLPGQAQQPQHQQHQQLGPPSGGQLQQSKGKLDNNDILAIVIGLFIPGVGQLMLGQTTKGIVVFAVSVLTCYGAGLLPIAIAIDAYLVAMTKKYREVGEWEVFPDMNKHFGSG